VFGGMRAALLMRDAAPPASPRPSPAGHAGKEIRVTFADGSRRSGRLIALSDTDVTFVTADGERRVPLVNVDRIDRVSHSVRNAALWSAAVAAGTAAALIPIIEDDGPADAAVFVVSWAGLAGAAGAGVGALFGRASRDHNILYRSPRVQASVTLVPVVWVRRAGVMLSMNW
jgi:hypothetical protein